MTDKRAYVVMQEEGMYDDYDARPVAVHLTQEDAEAHKDCAYEWAKNFWDNRPIYLTDGDYTRIMEYNRAYSNPYDTSSRAPQDSSFNYYVVEVPFYE